MIKKTLALLVVASALFYCGSGGEGLEKPKKGSKKENAKSSKKGLKKNLAEELQSIHKEPDMINSVIGFCMIPAGETEPVFEYSGQTSLATASTMKIITTATALSMLGKEHTFETAIATDGEIGANGVLTGNLIVLGGGDPTLGAKDGDDVIESWVKVIRQMGITSVTGAVVGDESYYDGQPIPGSWAWYDMGNYFGAGTSGLSFMENTYRIFFKPSPTVGQLAKILRTEPSMPSLDFVNEMKTGLPGSGDNGFIYGAPYSSQRFLCGTIPAGYAEFPIKGSMPEPPLVCAFLFDKALKRAGIKVTGEPTTARLLKSQGKTLSVSRKLFTQKSPDLAEIAKETNYRSMNLYAEMLLKAVGKNSRPNTEYDECTYAVKKYWENKGVDTQGFAMNDGSGLSRANGVTARQMATIVSLMKNDSNYTAFFESLPVWGQSGTLSNVGNGTLAEGRIHAKSGFISRVRGYSGYVKSKSGKEYAFAILVNNYFGGYASMTGRFERLANQMVLFED